VKVMAARINSLTQATVLPALRWQTKQDQRWVLS
jgi:hypothetical protein